MDLGGGAQKMFTLIYGKDVNIKCHAWTRCASTALWSVVPGASQVAALCSPSPSSDLPLALWSRQGNASSRLLS